MVNSSCEENLTPEANHFMTYHSILKTSPDYYTTLSILRDIVEDIWLMLSTGTNKMEVFSYIPH